jgi:O-antigen biosynthesis protein
MKWILSLSRRFNLTISLRSLYFWIFPINTKRYQIAHSILRNILIHFRPLNIQYQKWIKTQDSFNLTTISKYQEKVKAFAAKPIISIIMPVYNPKVEFLSQAIQSVIDQVYPYWELCVADDASTDPEIAKMIRSYAAHDRRIKTVFRKTNGHISAASNSALALATGEYSALLDHDDKLHPLALYHVVEIVNQNPDSKVIFSDEDKITGSGKRIEPYFKSDFDEELFLCQNMVSHLGVYKTETIRDIGGFRVGLEGSQDYDLMLRVLERTKTSEIDHIPRILYHWRISKQSAAESVNVKPYALKAGEQALVNHLENREIHASVVPYYRYGYKILYQVPVPKPIVEVLIPPAQGQSFRDEIIHSMLSSKKYDKLLVNGISCGHFTKSQVKEISKNCLGNSDINKKLLKSNFINRSVENSHADVIAIIHPHTCSIPDEWLESLLGILYKPGVGAVSPQLVGNNGLIFSSGIILGKEIIARHIFMSNAKVGPDQYFGWANLDKGYSALPPGCILVKREMFLEVGGLNQNLISETAQVIDFCLRLKNKGLRNIVTPAVQVTVNPWNVSSSADEDLIQDPSDREYFCSYWMNWLKYDPAFNPNLTLHKGRPFISNNPKTVFPFPSS